MATNWDDEVENLKKYYLEDGLTQKEIGKIYGVCNVTLRYHLEKFGILQLKEKPQRKVYKYVCKCCGKEFETFNEDQKFCSPECSREYSKKIPGQEIFLKDLADNNYNYLKLSKIYGVSDTAIKKHALKYGVHFPKQKDWSDVIDLETAQNKINELGVLSSSDLNENFGGLSDRLSRLGLANFIVYPKSSFDSSWENKIFSLISDNSKILGISNISHNIILSKECKDIRPLIFDIVIEYKNSYSKTVVEINGPTHFWDVYGDGRYDKTISHDKMKYEYCTSNRIDILYFTYDPTFIENYSYPYPIITNENLLLDKLKEISFKNKRESQNP